MAVFYTITGPTTTTTFLLSEVESVMAAPGRIIITMRSGARIDHGAVDRDEAIAVHDAIVKAMVGGHG
jgi:hypothetical protein